MEYISVRKNAFKVVVHFGDVWTRVYITWPIYSLSVAGYMHFYLKKAVMDWGRSLTREIIPLIFWWGGEWNLKDSTFMKMGPNLMLKKRINLAVSVELGLVNKFEVN